MDSRLPWSQKDTSSINGNPLVTTPMMDTTFGCPLSWAFETMTASIQHACQHKQKVAGCRPERTLIPPEVGGGAGGLEYPISVLEQMIGC